jgi:branched-chain amino acid transport system substrate-binding protein
MRYRRTGLALITTASLVAAACGSDDSGDADSTPAETAESSGTSETSEAPVSAAPSDTTLAEETEAEPATGDPIQIGWITDATSVTRNTYYPEYEGARLYFEELNQAGGINGRPVEILVEDMKVDAELAVTAATKLLENDDVIMLAGGTIEGRLPPIFDVARAEGAPFLTGHSARPDMFPDAPDPLLFTVGNVFEAMTDARVKVWPELFNPEFPDGGTSACYIHESPAAVVVCDRWLAEQAVATPEWQPGVIASAPLQTTDFTPFVRPVVDSNPTVFFDISIASHAIGVAVTARNLGYVGPIAFSMTATPEPDIDEVIDQVGGEDIYAISNIVSIDETDVPEVQRVLEAAEEHGTETAPSSAMLNGWLMGMVIADSLERCGESCDRATLRDALEATDLDTRGITGGNLTYSPTDHVGLRYWTGYKYDTDQEVLVRAIDGWITFDGATDLLAPLGG